MSPRFDGLDAHLEVLVLLRRRAGSALYERALLAAKIAVARVLLAEAERLAGVGAARPEGKIVRFRRLRTPLSRRPPDPT